MKFKAETIKEKKKVIGCYVFGFENGKDIHTIVNQTEKQKQTGEFTSHIVNPNSVKLLEDKEKMQEFMLQQLLGYRLGKEGYSITDLINGAGLSKQEWINIKDEVDCTSLCEEDKIEIEEYVNNLKELEIKKNGAKL